MSNSPSIDGLVSLGAYNYLLYVINHRDFIYVTELRNDMYYLAKRDLMKAAPILPSDITMTEDEFFAQAFSVYHQHFNYDYAPVTENQFGFLSTYYRLSPDSIQEIDSTTTPVTLQIVDFDALSEFWVQSANPISNIHLPEESFQVPLQNSSETIENDIKEETLYQLNQKQDLDPRQEIELINTIISPQTDYINSLTEPQHQSDFLTLSTSQQERSLQAMSQNSSILPKKNFQEEVQYQLTEEKEVQIQFDQINSIPSPKEKFDQFINQILLNNLQFDQSSLKPPLNLSQRKIKFKKKKIKQNLLYHHLQKELQHSRRIQKKKKIKKFYHKIKSPTQPNQNESQLHWKQLIITDSNHDNFTTSKIGLINNLSNFGFSDLPTQYESPHQFNRDQFNKSQGRYDQDNYQDNQQIKDYESRLLHHKNENHFNRHQKKKLIINDVSSKRTRKKMKQQQQSQKLSLKQQQLKYSKMLRQFPYYHKRDKINFFSNSLQKFQLSRMKQNFIQNKMINSRKSQELFSISNEKKYKRNEKKISIQKEEINEQYNQILIKTQQFLIKQFNTKQKKAILNKTIQQQLSSEKTQFALALYSTQLQFASHTSFRKMDQQASMYLFNALQQKHFEKPTKENDIAIYILQQIFSDNFTPNDNYPNHDYILNGDIRNERNINNQQVRVQDKSSCQTLFNINVNYPYEVATQISKYDKITFLFPIQGNNCFSSSQENCLNQIISKLTLHKSIWTKESLLRWIENNQNLEKILSQMFYYQLEIIKILNVDFFSYNNMIAIRGRPITIPLSPFTLKPKQLTFFELTERQEDQDMKIIFRITNHFSLLAEHDQQIWIDLESYMSKEEISPYKILVKLKNLTEQEILINQISIFIN